MTAPSDDGFAYDAFVSYRQQEPDKTWVRKTLVPALDAAGLRVFIDYRDFVLGEPIVTEMARAVVQSRYTLAVLTPAYLTSGFTEFENVLAQHLGLEEQARRLLLVRRERCDAPPNLRFLFWLDMLDDEQVAEGLPRLVAALRQPATGG
jgi:TIR domain